MTTIGTIETTDEPGTDLVLPVPTILPTAPILAHLKNHTATTRGHEPEHLAARAELWEGGNAHDKQVLAAHEALTAGRQLVDLRGALMKSVAGIGSELPQLAVARADMKRVTCRRSRNGTVRFEDERRFSRWNYEHAAPTWSSDPIRRSGIADVPTVPPKFRVPNMKDRLIIWEAAWRKVTQRNEIHINLDPALLEHVVGDLYVVVAAWELTELEAAALGGG